MENQTVLDLSQVSQQQFSKMKHALGLNKKKKPCRNYFYCSGNDKDWNDLVDKGFAIKRGSWTKDTSYFHLTFEATKLIYGKRMSKKYYEEL